LATPFGPFVDDDPEHRHRRSGKEPDLAVRITWTQRPLTPLAQRLDERSLKGTVELAVTRRQLGHR
jgi:hypothetical protein